MKNLSFSLILASLILFTFAHYSQRLKNNYKEFKYQDQLLDDFSDLMFKRKDDSSNKYIL